MERKERRVIFACVVILIFLLVDFCTAMKTYIGYNSSKKSGNERWKQVEERIILIEDDINNLKMEVQEWKR